MPPPRIDPAATVATLWPEAVARGGGPPFLVREGREWNAVGWEEADRVVEEVAAGLIALGVGPGDRVALLARTSLEWIACDHALAGIGGVVVPVYPTAAFADVVHVLNDSGAGLLVCEAGPQLERIGRARDELRGLETVVGIGGGGDLTFDALRERGRAALASRPGEVDARRARVAAGDLLTIVYTSGTSGPPKGCELTHGNWRAHLEMIAAMTDVVRPGDRTVLHLPLAHVFGRLVGLMGARAPLTIALCPDTAHLASALTATRPTIFVSVPRLFERARDAAFARIEGLGGPRRALARSALATARAAGARRRAGERIGPLLAARLAVADRLVLSQVRERFGGELRIAISGGAALPREVGEFFDDIGIALVEGYGLTECTTVAAVSRPGSNRLGTVGPAVPGGEVRIGADGEVLLRGPHVFRGYHGNAEATQAILDEEGWLRTGDVGSLDDAGRLAITDRKKDLIVTPSGKNVAPQRIEAMLRESPLVAQALVVGSGRPRIGALIEVDPEAVRHSGLTEEEVPARIAGAVAEVNRRLGVDERVRCHAVLPRPFDVEEGEVTPTLKLRRKACEEHFRDLIDAMYARA